MEERVFLLADDDSDDTQMFVEALGGVDDSIICHCAVDGREALNILDEMKVKPRLIFLDVNMPVMNGWQCLKILKEDERYKHIAVIVISTSSHQREINIATDLGALCYLTKPNKFDELQLLLKVMVNNHLAELPNAIQNMQMSGLTLTSIPPST